MKRFFVNMFVVSLLMFSSTIAIADIVGGTVGEVPAVPCMSLGGCNAAWWCNLQNHRCRPVNPNLANNLCGCAAAHAAAGKNCGCG